MPIARVRGVELNYLVVGDDGPWLALMPGGRRGYDEITAVAGRVATEGYRVLLHDRRNTGASEIRIGGPDSEEEIWADDLAALLEELATGPAFVGGFSSGSRVAMLVALRHRQMVHGLILCRVTGGPTAADRLPRKYYDQFIEAAEAGGLPAVVDTDEYRERLAANPGNRERLLAIDRSDYLAAMRAWREAFVAGASHAVLGVSPAGLAAIRAPALVVPGNDRTHSTASAIAAAEGIPGARLHVLPLEQQDRDLIPYAEWSDQEAELAAAFVGFMAEVEQRGVDFAPDTGTPPRPLHPPDVIHDLRTPSLWTGGNQLSLRMRE